LDASEIISSTHCEIDPVWLSIPVVADKTNSETHADTAASTCGIAFSTSEIRAEISSALASDIICSTVGTKARISSTQLIDWVLLLIDTLDTNSETQADTADSTCGIAFSTSEITAEIF